MGFRNYFLRISFIFNFFSHALMFIGFLWLHLTIHKRWLRYVQHIFLIKTYHITYHIVFYGLNLRMCFEIMHQKLWKPKIPLFLRYQISSFYWKKTIQKTIELRRDSRIRIREILTRKILFYSSFKGMRT